MLNISTRCIFGVLLSYLGYANELGESFKSFISTTTYRGTYAVAIAYGKLFNRLSFARKVQPLDMGILER